MPPRFIFAACKIGYEEQCKSELLAACPNLRFSFSRPGFQTFKITEGSVDFSHINRLTFVRLSGINLGKFKLENGLLEDQNLAELKQALDGTQLRHLHFWPRNLGGPNDEDRLDFMKGNLSETGAKMGEFASRFQLRFNEQPRVNEKVFNLIEVDPDEIWYGIHRVESPQQAWPGGLIRLKPPEKVISRAYFKTRESILWSRFPLQPDQTCIEIGCAPGGSVQALLESGLQVIGIDPAEVDPSLLENLNFHHIRKRAAEVRKKKLAGAKWLLADSNVAPRYTLDAVDEIVNHRLVNLRGLILTLKLLQPEMAQQIEEYRERVRQMGFQYVRTRQLAFNRNEICLAALKRKSILRFGKR